MAGVLWTGIDVFMALVVGPVLGALSVDERRQLVRVVHAEDGVPHADARAVTIFGGITLAVRIGVFPNAVPWIALFSLAVFGGAALLLGWFFDSFRDRRWQAFLAIVIVAKAAYLSAEVAAAGMSLPGTRLIIVLILAVMVVLTVQGFGLLMPTEVLVYLESVTDEPYTDRTAGLSCGTRSSAASRVPSSWPSSS